MKSTRLGRTKFAPSGSKEPDTVLIPVKRKYGKPETVWQIYNLTKGKQYSLIKAGLIKSVSLREPGRSRGSRLIDLESVEAYLSSLQAAEA
jgi:hypothetical protein